MQPNPRHPGTVLRLTVPGYHRQMGTDGILPEFYERLNVARIVDMVLGGETWKGRCEIIPDFVGEFASPGTRGRCVVRIPIRSTHPNHEPEGYSYLRCVGGAMPGTSRFFWDVYGDDMGCIEVALFAIMQAPAPYYTGPTVHKL